MAKKIEGWVDQFVAPEGYDHGDGEHIYVSKAPTPSMDHRATLVIHEGKPEKVWTESEVKAALKHVTHCTGSRVSSVDIKEFRRVINEQLGITLD